MYLSLVSDELLEWRTGEYEEENKGEMEEVKLWFNWKRERKETEKKTEVEKRK